MPRVQEFSAILNASATSMPVTVPAGGIPVGEFLVMTVCARSSAAQSVSATDTRGNTWVLDRSDVIGAGGTTAAVVSKLSCEVTTALQAGDTITLAFGTAVTRAAVTVDHHDDVVLSTDAGTSNDNGGAASSTPTSGSTSTTVPDTLLSGGVGWVTSTRTLAGDAPWSDGSKVVSTAGTVDRAVQSMWRYVTSTGSYAASGTFSGGTTLYAALIQAYEIDAGTNLSLPTATETDTAAALTATEAGTLPTTAETDAAGLLTAAEARTLPIAAETDVAAALSATEARTLPVAAELDTASALTAAETRTLSTASETDIADVLSVTQANVLPTAIELDTATSLIGAEELAIPLVVETDSAGVLTVGKFLALPTAIETDVAGVLGVQAGELVDVTVSVGPTRVGSVAVGATRSGSVSVGDVRMGSVAVGDTRLGSVDIGQTRIERGT